MASRVPTRELGNTGEEVSILGLGGYHIGLLEEKDSIQLIRQAIDQGITFLDNAWCYHNGLSEKIMGRALQDGYREKAFLMTKNHGRTVERFNKQLEDSLKRLQTDYIDLLQFHEIINEGEPAKIEKEKVLEAALKAKEAGKIRYLGFTGHRDPHYHQQMLELDIDWDTLQIPVNLLDYHYRSFQKQLIPQAEERGIGVIGMKSLASGRIFNTDLTVEEAISYCLSLPISTLVSGIDSFQVLEQNLEIVENFQPATEEELYSLRTRLEPEAYKGQHEYYKH
ncbi:MAG: aldo/keto reductase [Halanaerobiaceae bacterium]